MGWHGSRKPTGRTARKRDMVVLMPSALGDLGLDLLNAAAEKVGHIGDRHAVSHKLVRSATSKADQGWPELMVSRPEGASYAHATSA